MASRSRDSGRVHTNGSQRRKKKAEHKQQRLQEAASNRRITDMFATPAPMEAISQRQSDDSSKSTTTSESSPAGSSSDSRDMRSVEASDEAKLVNSVDLEDPATWPFPINDEFRSLFVESNIDQKFDASSTFEQSARAYDDGRTRYLNSSLFYRKLTNGETAKRTWLLYSQSTGKVYCSVCKRSQGTRTQKGNRWVEIGRELNR